MSIETTYRCPKCGSLNLFCEYTIVLRLGNPEEGEDQGPILDDFDQVNCLEPAEDALMLCDDCEHQEHVWTFAHKREVVVGETSTAQDERESRKGGGHHG